jgi:hypothetical protein
MAVQKQSGGAREDTDSASPGAKEVRDRPQRGEIQFGIADADKQARTGSDREQLRNTPPAGDWNDVA